MSMSDRIKQRYQQLTDALTTLNANQLVEVSLNCAEQVIEFIDEWSSQEGSPLAVHAHHALDFVRQNRERLPQSRAELLGYLDLIEAALPHTEDSDTLSPSGALDAGLSLLGLLRCALNPSVENALQAAEGAITAYDIRSYYEVDSQSMTFEQFAPDLATGAVQEWERQLAFLANLRNL